MLIKIGEQGENTMRWNPNAVLFWAVGAGIGCLCGGAKGALVGFVVTGGISVLATFLPDTKR